jgi:hypothetical protein
VLGGVGEVSTHCGCGRRRVCSQVGVALSDVGLSPSQPYCVRDMWARAAVSSTPVTGSFSAALAAHGSGVYGLVAASGGTCS